MVKENVVKLDGLEQFPFESFGLTRGSIKRKGEYLLVPVELTPYLKLCILPVRRRIEIADYMYKWRKNRRRHNGNKSSTKKEKR